VASFAHVSGLESTARVGQRVDELDTPVLLVDLDRLERNIARWQKLADDAGVELRVHVKTHKVPAIALMQLAAGACGIVCAKVGEAEVFADGGCDDIVVAYPVFGEEKWRRLAELARRARIGVNVDSIEAVNGISLAASAAAVTIELYLDVDTGMHRGGVDYRSIDELVGMCAAIARAQGVELAGVTTHRQLAYATAGDLAPDEAGRDEAQVLAGVAEELRHAGHEIRVVAAGGSISGRGLVSVPGVNELRAGTYVFCDLMQLGHGVAAAEDLALSILCTVVSTRQPGGATVDGGLKTFSGDRSSVGERSFARAVDRDLVLDRLSEEHGMAVVGDDEVRLGEKIRFFPAHACTAVNLSDQLVGVRGDLVEVVWPVLARGKRT
jgi:D-serine deaminase-like pyridoxal phosphate-dependent protein